DVVAATWRVAVVGEIDPRLLRLGSGDGFGAHDEGDLTAVQVVLLDGVARLALRVQTAKGPFEIAEACDPNRLIDRSAREEIDERGVRGADPGDGPHAAWNLFDVDTGIRQGRGHDSSSMTPCQRG